MTHCSFAPLDTVDGRQRYRCENEGCGRIIAPPPTAIKNGCPPTADCPKSAVTFAAKAMHFSAAMLAHAASGLELRSQGEIDALLLICRECEQFDGHKCSQCGCTVSRAKNWRNKLAIATEHCPLAKWP